MVVVRREGIVQHEEQAAAQSSTLTRGMEGEEMVHFVEGGCYDGEDEPLGRAGSHFEEVFR